MEFFRSTMHCTSAQLTHQVVLADGDLHGSFYLLYLQHGRTNKRKEEACGYGGITAKARLAQAWAVHAAVHGWTRPPRACGRPRAHPRPPRNGAGAREKVVKVSE